VYDCPTFLASRNWAIVPKLLALDRSTEPNQSWPLWRWTNFEMNVSLDTRINLLPFSSQSCLYPSNLLCSISSLERGTLTTPVKCLCCCLKSLFCWSIFGFVNEARSFLILERCFQFQAHNLSLIALMNIAIHYLNVSLSGDSCSTLKTLQNRRFSSHYVKEICPLGFSHPELPALLGWRIGGWKEFRN